MSSHVSLFAALAVTAVAAIYDLRSWRIPNWLSLGALAAAPVAHFAVGAAARGARAGLDAAGWSVVGALVCAAVPFFCWRAGTFGGGDVKLLAAVGAICLPKLGVAIELDAMIVGLVVACGRLAYDGRLLRTIARSARVAVNPLLPKSRRAALPAEAMTPMRFAPAIAAAVLLCAIAPPG